MKEEPLAKIVSVFSIKFLQQENSKDTGSWREWWSGVREGSAVITPPNWFSVNSPSSLLSVSPPLVFHSCLLKKQASSPIPSPSHLH